MKFEKSPIEGASVVIFKKHEDFRGTLERIYCGLELKKAGIYSKIAQINLVSTSRKSTIRGLHYQTAPHGEIKLVRCLTGAIFDVIADVRKDSKTYGKWFGITLSRENRKMMVVPKDCAHGYQTLRDHVDVIYPTTEFYSPEHEKGIRWDDPFFRIRWPLENPVVSDKDHSFADFFPEPG